MIIHGLTVQKELKESEWDARLSRYSVRDETGLLGYVTHRQERSYREWKGSRLRGSFIGYHKYWNATTKSGKEVGYHHQTREQAVVALGDYLKRQVNTMGGS